MIEKTKDGSRRIDAAETVRYGSRRTRQEHAHIAQLLVLAVKRNAGQRGKMLAVLRKQHAGPRRYRALEVELGGDAELARAGGGAIPDRIGQMIRPRAERDGNYLATHLNLRAGGLFWHFCEHHLVAGVRADGDQRIGRELRQLVPAHAQLLAEGHYIDLIAGGEFAHDPAQLVLAVEAAEKAIELAEHMALG